MLLYFGCCFLVVLGVVSLITLFGFWDVGIDLVVIWFVVSAETLGLVVICL